MLTRHLPTLAPTLALGIALAMPNMAQAFCGFYVAKADASLYNNASKVVLTRDGERSVVTMASDYQGEPRDFAMVIPVPEVLKRDQIKTTRSEVVDRLDKFSAPRLVEYHDPDPCWKPPARSLKQRLFGWYFSPNNNVVMSTPIPATPKPFPVRILAEYEVDEYDVKILSADQSGALLGWLNRQGYKIPDAAAPVIRSYLKQEMKFLVARVNLDRLELEEGSYLPPLQIAYSSPRFMLPIRLGTVNAKGDQELFIYALTRKGRIETSNYRTKKLPTGMDIPIYVRSEFPAFYKAMFDQLVKEDNKQAVYLEYAWDVSIKCDPCVAGQLVPSELYEMGAHWIAPSFQEALHLDRYGLPSGAFITRLHLRYDADSFPEDLKFIETGNTENWQARYVLRHPAKVSVNQCDKANPYLNGLLTRFDQEAANLASLTGWPIEKIRDRMDKHNQPRSFPGLKFANLPWYKRLWSEP
ncbi:MAG: DUF2330 domain-containing protein [Alphaproteobacteria bacterium]